VSLVDVHNECHPLEELMIGAGLGTRLPGPEATVLSLEYAESRYRRLKSPTSAHVVDETEGIRSGRRCGGMCRPGPELRRPRPDPMRARHTEPHRQSRRHRTTAAPTVALVTCHELPDLDADDRPLVDHLVRLGLSPVPAIWHDPAVDWSVYDLVVLRSPCHHVRRDEFMAWCTTVPQVSIPADLVAWNTHKWYLNDLAAKGIPIIATQWLAPGDCWELPSSGEYVLKPATGSGGHGTGRYRLDDARDRDLAEAHIRRLHMQGTLVMLQPYLPGVDCCGETNLVYLDGEYSHAIHRSAVLAGPDMDVAPSYAAPSATPRPPTIAEYELAERVLTALPIPRERLLFARVDVVPGPDGRPLVIEVDVTEPSLFLRTTDGAARRLAVAIADRVMDMTGVPA